MDTLDQIRLPEGLLQKIDRAALHRLHGFRDSAMAGNEDDRDGDAAITKMLLQFQAVHARHSVIKDQTAQACFVIGCQKGLGGFEGLTVQAAQVQSAGQR